MPTLTKDEALRIAQAFAGFAKTVENYRFAHFSQLTDLQEASLRNVETTLRTTSNNLLDLGINLSLDDVSDALEALGDITNKLNKDLTTLTNIDKALQVVGALVQLGTAFATGSPPAIVAAFKSTVAALPA